MLEGIAPPSLSSATTATDRTKFSQEDFLKLLTAELTNQDPLNPLDQVQFLEQLASLQTLESTAALTDGIGALMKFQGLGAASSLIGKLVLATSDEGESIQGIVDSVSYDSLKNEVKLVVGGKLVSLENVREIGIPFDEVDQAIAESDSQGT